MANFSAKCSIMTQEMVDSFCESFYIPAEVHPTAPGRDKTIAQFPAVAHPQINTAVAHPQANGLVEKANRSLMEGIKTRLGKERKGWVDELPNVLWAHRTSLKTSNGETPYSLTFGSEAVIMSTGRTKLAGWKKSPSSKFATLEVGKSQKSSHSDNYKTKKHSE
ncbi:reverse transcriptase domain-containing protein [Tanacetum coccineum]